MKLKPFPRLEDSAILKEMRRDKAWFKRWRAYMVLRHGIGLAIDAGMEQAGIRVGGEEHAMNIARSLLREAAEWAGLELQEPAL